MMTWSTFIFAAAFIAVAALLLWITIGAKGPWWAKLALIVAVPAFGLFVWGSMDSLLGWPTPVPPPPKALMLWGAIQEPGSAGKGDPGRIFLWLVPADGSSREVDLPMGTPRAYVLPYTREMHKLVQSARERIKAGKQVVLEHGKRGRGERGRRGRDGAGNGAQAGEYRSYDLPPPAIRKE
jgi:hypothetical protein